MNNYLPEDENGEEIKIKIKTNKMKKISLKTKIIVGLLVAVSLFIGLAMSVNAFFSKYELEFQIPVVSPVLVKERQPIIKEVIKEITPEQIQSLK